MRVPPAPARRRRTVAFRRRWKDGISTNLKRSLAAHALTVVPVLELLAALLERALPQKDNPCGPFWGALALHGSSGGVLCVCPAAEADALRESLGENGYALRDWDDERRDRRTES